MEALVRAGMSSEQAGCKAALFAMAEHALHASASAELLRWFVPGRIEVLGKHTDYAGGRSLLCTAERGLCVVAKPRGDSQISVIDAYNEQSARFEFTAALTVPAVGWHVYPMTVARRLAQNFTGTLHGADIAFASDLPRAAGMSSSSALIVAIFQVLSAVNGLPERDEYRTNIHNAEELAGYLGCIENGQSYGSLIGDRGVGTFGGSEDHTAIFSGHAGQLVQYSFCPVRFERSVSLPPDCIFVIGASGIVADKIGSARDKYNRASLAARAVLESWNAASGRQDATLAAAVCSSLDAAERIRSTVQQSNSGSFDRETLVKRFDQFLLESETIVPQAAEALERRDLVRFGELVQRSQQASENLLGNQVPETIALAREARAFGAYAASAFGAGFGGSVWALVAREGAQDFGSRWKAVYESEFPAARQRSRFFTTNAGPGSIAF